MKREPGDFKKGGSVYEIFGKIFSLYKEYHHIAEDDTDKFDKLLDELKALSKAPMEFLGGKTMSEDAKLLRELTMAMGGILVGTALSGVDSNR